MKIGEMGGLDGGGSRPGVGGHAVDTHVAPPDAEGSRANDSPPEYGARPARILLEVAVMVALALVISMVVRANVAQALWIPTGSMEPTIMVDDRIIAEKITYRFHDPSAGDVVAFDDPAGLEPLLLKRVIAVEGQTVDIRDGEVVVDGRILDEPYVHGSSTRPGTVALPVVVPEGHVWVMGDNRENSHDSRFFGPQPVKAVEGRAVFIYWPLDHAYGL